MMSDGTQGDPMREESAWDLVSVLCGIAIGAVFLGAIWLLVVVSTGGSDHGTSPDAATDPGATVSSSASTASQPDAPTRLERCRAAADAIERPVQVAQPALDQWAVHIGAMNKLVTGAITLKQATAFWNQTRVGAYDRIGRFEDGDAQLNGQGVDCPRAGLLGSGASPALRACAQHVAAELQELHSARTAITTWHHHMLAMDQLRDGKLSPTAATRMWLMMWQRGVHELDEFHADARAAQHAGDCQGTTDTSHPSVSSTEEPRPNPALPTAPTPSPATSPMESMTDFPTP
jgi:hypothetical protein